MTGRVAIYAVPGTGSQDPTARLLKQRAESWLGRRVDGLAPDPDLPTGWTREAADAITVDARRYGFHGTLKAPFRLAEGSTLERLDQDVERFAATRAAVEIPHLALTRMGSFFALTPGEAAPELHALTDALVEAFDGYRAPATEAEIARRDPAALSPRRRELLETWGYPYVFDEFRFHLTVTDRIPTDRQLEVHATLADWFADCLGRPIAIESLALLTESEPGAPFRLHSIHPLQRPVPLPHASEAFDHEGTR
ncbi:MAG: hypothetical protein JWP75_2859 [Frondihabitans sp.]|nr:hypothetical protein [Frondihabitans sp.]